jgi:hypothetical protein
MTSLMRWLRSFVAMIILSAFPSLAMSLKTAPADIAVG